MENTKKPVDFGRSLYQQYETDRCRTPGAVNVVAGATPTLIMLQNAERIFAAITNDGANPVYLAFSAAGCAVNQGIRLNANGGAFWFGILTDFVYTGEVWAFSTLGTTLSFLEA